MKSIRFCLLLLFAIGPGSVVLAQDTILKRNGDIIFAKILEVRTNAISFKKSNFTDGPTFVENKVDLFMIKYGNGERQEFKEMAYTNVTESVSTLKQPGNAETSTMPVRNPSENDSPNAALKNGPVSTSYRIEQLNGRYMVNGQKIGRRELDRQLGRSNNTAVKWG